MKTYEHVILIFLLFIGEEFQLGAGDRAQTIGNVFEIPIQTLTAVSKLIQESRPLVERTRKPKVETVTFPMRPNYYLVKPKRQPAQQSIYRPVQQSNYRPVKQSNYKPVRQTNYYLARPNFLKVQPPNYQQERPPSYLPVEPPNYDPNKKGQRSGPALIAGLYTASDGSGFKI